MSKISLGDSVSYNSIYKTVEVVTAGCGCCSYDHKYKLGEIPEKDIQDYINDIEHILDIAKKMLKDRKTL